MVHWVQLLSSSEFVLLSRQQKCHSFIHYTIIATQSITETLRHGKEKSSLQY